MEKKVAVIRKCKKGDSVEGKPICLYTHDGSRLLGRHPSVESARKQEAAIKAQGNLKELITAFDTGSDDFDANLSQEILNDMDAWSSAELVEYAKELKNKGLFASPEEFETLSSEASEVAHEPINFATLDEVLGFMEWDQTNAVKNELMAIIIGLIRDDDEEQTNWKEDLQIKYVSQGSVSFS
jgi:hypothetical protein